MLFAQNFVESINASVLKGERLSWLKEVLSTFEA